MPARTLFIPFCQTPRIVVTQWAVLDSNQRPPRCQRQRASAVKHSNVIIANELRLTTNGGGFVLSGLSGLNRFHKGYCTLLKSPFLELAGDTEPMETGFRSRGCGIVKTWQLTRQSSLTSVGSLWNSCQLVKPTSRQSKRLNSGELSSVNAKTRTRGYGAALRMFAPGGVNLSTNM